ncbi:MAG: hypothetical protein AAB213_02280 [Candidatus Omnitrophota bacterium]
METKFKKLSLFFDTVKIIGFWQRIFGWRYIRNLSYDAYKEFNELMDLLAHTDEEFDDAKNSIAVLNNDNEHLKSEKNRFDKSLEIMQAKFDTVNKENSQLKNENVVFKQKESDRQTKYESDISALNSIRSQIENDRKKEHEEKQQNEIKRLQSLKDTWAKHQESVKQAIKGICEKHTIQYIDKVPFKGTPDNTIKLCDEFVIFDAKSPASDDLENFPAYLKTQTESVRKYVKEDGVRKDVFLVIPSNTVDVVESFAYNMADYNVYVVTLDVLEPLILTLKRIEDYEFVNQLSPEERENICRIVGKFAHMTKRRIQIDQFFAWEFLEILTKCKSDLPKEILDKVIEFEKSEKLNPPQERRAKQILNKDLESENEKIQKEAEAKGIIFPAMIEKKLNALPLYENEKSNIKEDGL